jgi:6-phosphogluconate dehydrogenase
MMKFGIIGLGRMGGGLALQAMEKGHQVVGYNRSPEHIHTLVRQGA